MSWGGLLAPRREPRIKDTRSVPKQNKKCVMPLLINSTQRKNKHGIFLFLNFVTSKLIGYVWEIEGAMGSILVTIWSQGKHTGMNCSSLFLLRFLILYELNKKGKQSSGKRNFAASGSLTLSSCMMGSTLPMSWVIVVPPFTFLGTYCIMQSDFGSHQQWSLFFHFYFF